MRRHLINILMHRSPPALSSFFFWLALPFVLTGLSACENSGKKEKSIAEPPPTIRHAVVAGQFYPGEKAELADYVDKLLGSAPSPTLDNPAKALILPHAGYIYSGGVAASGIKTLSKVYKRIIIIGSNHSAAARPFSFSISNRDLYETPLGKVPVSKVARELLELPLFDYVAEAHSTHIIETQLPFLQNVLDKFEIIPIITGNASEEELNQAAKIISGHLSSDTLLIVSSDLSHYHPYDKADKLDRQCIQDIADINIQESSKCEACGLRAALILLKIAKDKGWKGQVLDYKNSGDTAGDKSRVVGYSAIAFTESTITESDQKVLLKLSRSVLSSYVSTKKLPEPDSLGDTGLSLKRGCFVTLNESGELRGCIGDFNPSQPLTDCVIKNTVSAAVSDPRFPPVTTEELDQIEIEISILTPPSPYFYKTPQELLDRLIPLKTGVILSQGRSRSTYLPQVWEHLPDKKMFLTRLCLKGGMGANCWQDPRTEVNLYNAIVLKE